MTNKSTTEREDLIASTRKALPPGTAIYVVPRQSDRQGEPKSVSLLFVSDRSRIISLDFAAGAILRRQRDRKRGGLLVSWRDGINIALIGRLLTAQLGVELHGDPAAFDFVLF